MESNPLYDFLKNVSEPVGIKIYSRGEAGENAWVHRYIEKIKPCPDRTHLRLYFDGYHFLAISADCEITATDEGLTAYDPVGCLYYEIRKDCAK